MKKKIKNINPYQVWNKERSKVSFGIFIVTILHDPLIAAATRRKKQHYTYYVVFISFFVVVVVVVVVVDVSQATY